MIWIAGFALAAVFVKLGMLIVMVKMLWIGLGLMALTGGVLALGLIWRKRGGTKSWLRLGHVAKSREWESRPGNH